MGPCVHHDMVTSPVSGNTYVLATRASSVDGTGTAWDACGTMSRFLDDGFRVLDSSWAPVAEYFLMEDYGYDPRVDGGPKATRLASRPEACDSVNWTRTFDSAYDVIEWTHANSLASSNYGAREVIDMSIRQWDQVVRFDSATGELLWRLSPNEGYGDWGNVVLAPGIVGEASFQEQHDVHAVGPDTLMMLDNNGDPTGARVLEIALGRRPLAATIRKSWALVDGSGNPLDCPLEGTGQYVPGTTDEHILAVCSDEYAFMELADATGNVGTAPPLFVQLPDGSAEPICTAGGPASRDEILGWHKAYPLVSIGEF